MTSGLGAPWWAYAGPVGGIAYGISLGTGSGRKRLPTFWLRQDWSTPVPWSSPFQALPHGVSYEVRTPFSAWGPQSVAALSGVQGMNVQGPRSVHVAPPTFALDPVQQRLQSVLQHRPGGLLGLEACAACASGMLGLGVTPESGGIRQPGGYPVNTYSKSVGPATPFGDPVAALGSAPPTGYGAPIPGARSPEEALMQAAVASNQGPQAEAAYQAARAQGADHDTALQSAGRAIGVAVGGAGEGILGGIANVLGSILNPLAQGGATAYAIYQQQRINKDAEKARQQELLILQETRRRDQEFAAQQAAQRAAFWGQHGGKVAAGGVGLALALGAGAYFLSGRGSSGKRKGGRR